MNLMLWEYI